MILTARLILLTAILLLGWLTVTGRPKWFPAICINCGKVRLIKNMHRTWRGSCGSSSETDFSTSAYECKNGDCGDNQDKVLS